MPRTSRAWTVGVGVMTVALVALASAPEIEVAGIMRVMDEASLLTYRPTINFTGAGVSCADNSGSNRTDCTITGGGGGGGANGVETSVVLSASNATGYYTATVTGQTWVTASSIIVCQPFATTADGETVETITMSQIFAVASDRVAGTGFTLNVYNPNGFNGTVRIHCLGN